MGIVYSYFHGPIEENKSLLKFLIKERPVILRFCYVKLFQDRTSIQYLQCLMQKICQYT